MATISISTSAIKAKNLNYLCLGASGTVGSGIAVRFAKEGCQLALSGRDQSRLEATAQLCQDAGLSKDKVCCMVAPSYVITHRQKWSSERSGLSLERHN